MVPINMFRELASTDTVLIGAGVSSYSPRIVEVYGTLGFDFAFLDLEHDGFGPFDSEEIARFTRAAEVAGIELVVRLPSGSPATHPPRVRSVLDAGVRTVLLPRVSGPEEVRTAIRAARFSYDGEAGTRGIGASRVTSYGAGIDEDFADREDQSITVGVVMETREALASRGAILSVPNLGLVVPGPMDLAGSLGHPGTPEHESVTEAITAIETTARTEGIPLGTLFVPPDEAGTLLERDYQVLTLGSEISAAQTVFEEAIETVTAAAGADRRP